MSARAAIRWLLACLCCCTLAQAVPLGPDDGLGDGIALAPQLTLLRAPADSLSPEAIVAGRRDADFVPVDDQAVHCDQGMACWLRLELSRTADTPLLWWLRLRSVRPGTVLLHTAGAAPMLPQEFPLNWRYVGTDQFFALTPGTSAAAYYIELRDTRSADGFRLWQVRGFEQHQRQLAIYLSISMGVAFALMVLNLVFWRWLRDRLFLHFAALMAAAVALHLWQIVPSMAQPQHLGDAGVRGALQALMQMATILFIARLFDFRQHLPRASRMVGAFLALNLLAGVIALAGHPQRVETFTALLDLAGMAGAVLAAGWLLFFRRQWQYAWPAVLTLFLAFTSGLGRLRWLGMLEIGPDEGLGITWIAVRLSYMLLLAIIVADRTLALNRHRAQLENEIARRREAEVELATALASERRALQQQRQLVALVSHEFRTPLAVIDAAAQSISLPGVAVAPRLDRIRRAVHRLSLLVVNCLAEDRLQSDRLLFKPEPIALELLVDALAGHFTAGERTRLQVRIHAPSAVVMGDAALLEVALRNLVQNALKYSPPDREVDIHLRVDGGKACIDVEDHGGGMPPHEHAHVFERFFRGSRAGNTGGTGLGLFLGAEIARVHGGALQLLRSDARGSLFRLCLPQQPEPG